MTASGQIVENYPYAPESEMHTNVNYSSIFTELIQAAGLCEYYSSDIFYDLKAIEKSVEKLEDMVYYIGIRNNGVDGNSFVKSRLSQDKYGHEYIRLYRLELCRGDSEYTMILKRMDSYDVYKELMEK